MPELKCNELDIPNRLVWNARPIIEKFKKEEKLFRWFTPDTDYDYEGRLSEGAIKNIFSPPFDISCNRSSLCAYPTDVLYNTEKPIHRFDYGVVATKVEIIQGHSFEFLQTQQNGKTEQVKVRFELEHKPEECMYPHSEIIVFKNSEKIKAAVKPPLLKTAIRGELSKFFSVLHKPNPNFKPKEKVK